MLHDVTFSSIKWLVGPLLGYCSYVHQLNASEKTGAPISIQVGADPKDPKEDGGDHDPGDGSEAVDQLRDPRRKKWWFKQQKWWFFMGWNVAL